MSGAAEEQQYLWERGLSAIKETHVCSRHINDYAIKSFIKNNATEGFCNYCKKAKKVISLEKLMFRIMEGIMNFYEDAAEFMPYESREGGYQGTTYNQWELINDVVELDIDNAKLNEDIIDCIDDRAWSEPNQYYDSDKDILVYHWKFFKDVTKHKARYLFAQTDKFKTFTYEQMAYDILKEIGLKINEFKLWKMIKPGTKLYRCRQHDDKTAIKNADEIASPPDDKAIYSNRMSPAGISMFYCAFEGETAIAETIDKTRKDIPFISTAIFTCSRELKVIDLSNLPAPPSMFDIENFGNYYSTRFLLDFVGDISKGIKRDGKEHIEYVPTQIVTEYFRYVFASKDKIDGLIYPSSKRKHYKACVLFFNHEESLKELQFFKRSVMCNLVEECD